MHRSNRYSFGEYRFVFTVGGYIDAGSGSFLAKDVGYAGGARVYYRKNGGRRICFCGTDGLMSVVFAVVLWRSALSVGRKLIYSVLAVVILLSMAVSHRTEVWRTMQMVETVSQQRSLDGRLDGVQAALKIVCEYPLMGVGSGNYSLAADEYLYEDDYTPFTPIASGIAVQLPVEKGWIGVVLWLLIPIAMAGIAVRRRRSAPEETIILTTLVAIVVRETTFPTLLDYGGMQVLVFALLAVYANRLSKDSNPTYVIPVRVTRWLVWLPFIVCMGIFVADRGQERSEQVNRAGLQALSAGNWDEAEKLLDKAGDAVPYKMNRSALYWHRFKRTGEEIYLHRAEKELLEAAVRNPKDLRIEYGRAVVLDATGQVDSAQQIIRRLVERFPNNALYRTTLFEMLYRGGHKSRETEKHLVRAIELAPGILETPLWRQVLAEDSTWETQVKNILKCKAYDLLNRSFSGQFIQKQEVIRENRNPIDSFVENNVLTLAHYGKIMFTSRNSEMATVLLSRAVEALPNLSKPWSCLAVMAFETGDTISGRRFLRRAWFLDSDDELTRRLMEEYEPNKMARFAQRQNRQRPSYPYRFLYRSSRLKFDSWYGSAPLSFEYIGSEKTNKEF